MPAKGSWAQKQAKKAEFAEQNALDTGGDSIDTERTARNDLKAGANGGGDEELFEKKMSKEEKKAAAAAAKEARRAAKAESDAAKGKEAKPAKGKKGAAAAADGDAPEETIFTKAAAAASKAAKPAGSGNGAPTNVDELADAGVLVTYAAQKGKKDENSRFINVTDVQITFMGKPLVEGADITLNYGNRYGFVGPNGSGKSTIMKAIAARAIPIPAGIDIFFLDHEYPATDTQALTAVLESTEEVAKLEAEAEALNEAVADMEEAEQAACQERLEAIYERLDDLDAATAEVRASQILNGLGFTKKMQQMTTKEFSGGWRMRIALARALFLKPEFLLLDEPTNHLDMEAVVWLEEYLADWKKILFFVSHSQDFMNGVCTHIVRLDQQYRKIRYYTGDYDTYCKTRKDQDKVQMAAYNAEQKDIAEIKDFIARFGHGTVKMVRQAQAREKLLAKKLEEGLTMTPEIEMVLDWDFPDPGQLPVPVLQVERLSFGYPGCEELYTNVDFGIDLESRIALVGPNGAGKTTLVKLMTGELYPTAGAIRPHQHLKMARFTQHFEDALDLELCALEYFKTVVMPKTEFDAVRAYLGKYGCCGDMQTMIMKHLSDGQKARIVFARMAVNQPHLLLLDEPTNPLDMNGIDALARSINNFKGGCILVSHDMRLISQVAKEIWICDNKCVTQYQGDILKFKMKLQKESKKAAGGSGPSALSQHQNG